MINHWTLLTKSFWAQTYDPQYKQWLFADHQQFSHTPVAKTLEHMCPREHDFTNNGCNAEIILFCWDSHGKHVPCKLHWDSAPSRKHWALHHKRLSRTGGRSLPRKTEDRSLPFGGDRNGMKPASVGRRTVPDPDLHARWSEPAGTGCALFFRQN